MNQANAAAAAITRPIIDADGHVEPALVIDWRSAIGGDDGLTVDANAKRWFDLVGHGSSIGAGAWNAKARLADSDLEGIASCVLFGSSRGPGSIAGGEVRLEGPIARAFNDWMHSYCAEAPSRLKGTVWISLHDVDAAVAEVRRAVGELGAVGVVINPCATGIALDDPAYFPLYDALQELDAPALVHGTGAVGDFLTTRYQTHMRRHAVAFPLSLQMAMLDLVCGGVLDKFPRLRVALFEGGAGWAPWWIDRMDEHHEFAPYASPFITEKPSALVERYVAEHRLFWSCEPDEAHLPYAIEVLGEDAIVFASDYPHWDCTFPGAVDKLAKRTDLTDSAKSKLLTENAHLLYGARLA